MALNEIHADRQQQEACRHAQLAPAAAVEPERWCRIGPADAEPGQPDPQQPAAGLQQQPAAAGNRQQKQAQCPVQSVCPGVSTPFWMKRLPPVNGNSRPVLAASVPFSAS